MLRTLCFSLVVLFVGTGSAFPQGEFDSLDSPKKTADGKSKQVDSDLFDIGSDQENPLKPSPNDDLLPRGNKPPNGSSGLDPLPRGLAPDPRNDLRGYDRQPVMDQPLPESESGQTKLQIQLYPRGQNRGPYLGHATLGCQSAKVQVDLIEGVRQYAIQVEGELQFQFNGAFIEAKSADLKQGKLTLTDVKMTMAGTKVISAELVMDFDVMNLHIGEPATLSEPLNDRFYEPETFDSAFEPFSEPATFGDDSGYLSPLPSK